MKLLCQEKGCGAKHICKEFYNEVSSEPSVLLEIFCTRLTKQTRSLVRRPVADGRGLSEWNRISSM